MKVQIIKAICFLGRNFNHGIISVAGRDDQFAEEVRG